MKHVCLICIIVLSACGAKEISPVKIPDELLTCREIPTAPSEYSNATVGVYIIDLHETAVDCKGKLGAIKKAVK